MGQVRIARWDNSFPSFGPAARVPQCDSFMATPKRARSPAQPADAADSPWTQLPGPGSRQPAGQARLLRDGRRGKLQIVFALLCDREGRPVAAEVFEGKPLWRRLIGTMRSNWSTLRVRVVTNPPAAPN